VRVAWDLQAVTGPRPTGLGVSVGFLLDACKRFAQDIEVVGLRPNDRDQPLATVLDRVGWEQFRLPAMLRSVRRQQVKLCYSPALGAPISSPVPVVCHVHDLIPLIYPAQFSGVAGWYWKKLLPYTWKRCAALTVSNSTVLSDLESYLGVPRSNIHVVPYYPDPGLDAIAARLQPSTQFAAVPVFITLASHEPRKNIELAISALGLLKARGIQARLDCLGGRTAHTASLEDLAKAKGVPGQVHFPGYLSREKIVESMLQAAALLFVSRYEGYGMPPLEAMHVGCPVILSNIACHRQVYGDPERWALLPEESRAAPAMLMPDDDRGLADEMQQVIEDSKYRERLASSGKAYSRLFTPQATATALESAFLSVAGR